MFKIIVGSFIGCFFAVLSLWFIQLQYLDYQLENVKTNLVLEKEKSKTRENNLKTEVKNYETEIAVQLCLEAASKHHKKQATLKSVPRRGVSFLAINYFISNVQYHAQCSVKNNKVKRFNIIE
jgi:hypothetical protein